MKNDALLIKGLNDRRRELGLSYELLAKRCGLSRPTVQRILAGHHATASFANVTAIADSLGLELRFESLIQVSDLKRAQAEHKARELVRHVQGTSGLEGQAVDANSVDSMVKRTTDELLSGSKRKLWSEA
jgi:transcriptional regulator with XRE-family HTH domain